MYVCTCLLLRKEGGREGGEGERRRSDNSLKRGECMVCFVLVQTTSLL